MATDPATIATDSTSPQPSTQVDVRGLMLMEISKAMVRLYREQFGRGPESVRTYWCREDALVVVLEGTLTRAERNMVKMGEQQRLRDLRMLFQYASVREFCTPVEQITGRKVRSFVSGIDTEADGLSTETFVLHPNGYEGPSRMECAEDFS